MNKYFLTQSRKVCQEMTTISELDGERGIFYPKGLDNYAQAGRVAIVPDRSQRSRSVQLFSFHGLGPIRTFSGLTLQGINGRLMWLHVTEPDGTRVFVYRLVPKQPQLDLRWFRVEVFFNRGEFEHHLPTNPGNVQLDVDVEPSPDKQDDEGDGYHED